MKRNVFCLLLALALVVVAAFAMTPSAMATDDTEILVPTSEPESAEPHTHCVCGGEFGGVNGHVCEAVTYDKVLSNASFVSYSYKDSGLATKSGQVIRSGNYILDGDTTITKTIFIPYGDEVNICLNGHKLTSTVQTFKPNGKLTICDCSEEQTGSVYSKYAAQSPVFYTYVGSEVNIYGGTFSSATPSTGRNYAGCFTIAHDAGYFDYDADGDGAADTAPAPVMNIYGGKLIGSDLKATNTDLTKDPTIGRGGCGVIMHSDCTLNVYGGELVGGNTVPFANGGNLGGGVVYCAGTMNIMGGTFSGSKDPFGAIYTLATAAKVTVSGAPVFTGNQGSDIYMANGATLTVGAEGVSTAFTYTAGSIQGGAAPLATEIPAHQDVCVCGGKLTDAVMEQSGHECQVATEWQPLTAGNIGSYFKYASSKYYLKDDIDELYLYLTAEYTLSYPIEVADGKTLHIDLNGYTLTGHVTSTSSFRVIGTMTVCDSSTAGSGLLVARRQATGEGPIYLLNKPSGYAAPVMDIYGGTIIGYNQTSDKDATRTTAGKGGVIHVGNNSTTTDAAFKSATLNIYGGKIIGGLANRAGSIYVQGSTVNMYDGEITGGKVVQNANKQQGTGANVVVDYVATFNMYGGSITKGNAAAWGGNVYVTTSAASFNMYGGTISGGTAGSGGNVYVYSNATFHMYDGTISGGSSSKGGSICIDGGKFIMDNGTITGGTCSARGGNVYLTSTKDANGKVTATGSFTMNGGSITNGTAASRGGNVKVLRGNFTMTGGTIIGGALTDTSGSADVYGLDLAIGADSPAPNVTINGKVTIGELGVNGQSKSNAYAVALGANFATDTPIKVNTKSYGYVIKSTSREVLEANFVVADPSVDQLTFESGNAVWMRPASDDYHCKCGGNIGDSARKGIAHTCYDILWTPIDQAWVDAKIADTESHVTDDLAKASAWVIPVGNYKLVEDVTTTIPMQYADNANKVLNLDLNGHTFTSNTGDVKYGIIMRDRFNISDSAYDPADPNAQWGKILGSGKVGGSAIYVCTASDLSFLYGGEVAVADTAPAKTNAGGPVGVSGVLHMVNGQITGKDTSSDGGAVVINDNGSFTLWDGLVQGAKANQGGAIFMQKRTGYTTHLYIRGGRITGGKAAAYGGNIFAQGPVTMSGGIVENGESLSDSCNGGNIAILNATMTMTGGTIEGGQAREGGNISIRSGATLDFQGGIIRNGVARNHGGNIAAYTTLKISGGEIYNGSAPWRGGNISTYANSGKITITGGKIYNGILTNGDEVDENGEKNPDGILDKMPAQLYGANIAMNPAQSGYTLYLTVTGGEIGGFGEGCVEGVSSVHIASSGEDVVTTLGGTAVIDQIRLGTGRMITIDKNGFQNGASIGVERFEISGIFAPEVAEDYSAYFVCTEENTSIQAQQTETGYNLILVSSVPYYAYNEESLPLGFGKTIAEAMAIEGATYVRLLSEHSSEEVYEGDLYLDLNGNEVFGLEVKGNLYLMDSQGNDFKEDALGGFYGEATYIVPFFTNNETYISNTYSYFVAEDAEEPGLYRSHRVEVVLTHVSLKADADALGFRAEVMGDSVVKANITAYGFNMSLENHFVKTFMKTGAPVDGVFTLRLSGIMAGNGGEMNIIGQPFVYFGEDTLAGEESTTSMKKTILEVNKLTTLTETQKAAVYAMYEANKAVMDAWFAKAEDNKIATWAPIVEEPTPEPSEPETTEPETSEPAV